MKNNENICKNGCSDIYNRDYHFTAKVITTDGFPRNVQDVCFIRVTGSGLKENGTYPFDEKIILKIDLQCEIHLLLLLLRR